MQPVNVQNKYVFKPYSLSFPALFLKEKERIRAACKTALEIEHAGSTAVPGLGGKGIIDISITAPKTEIDAVTKQLQSLGYIFRPNGSTPERAFFIIDLPDPEETERRYHVHLTSPESEEGKGLIAFRDYLRAHPAELQEYAELKKRAALEANQNGEAYRKIKEPIFQKIK